MKRVAVFGNTVGGKSRLALHLAEVKRLPLYPLDRIQYKAGGAEIPHDEYLRAHTNLLVRDEWIYIDLPLFTHFRWVTKRLIQGAFVLFGAAP